MRFTLALRETEAVSGWTLGSWILSAFLLLIVIILGVLVVKFRAASKSQPPERQVTKSPRRSTSTWLIIGVFFISLLFVGAAIGFGRGKNPPLAIVIPLLLIAGILILVDAVAVLVVIFMRHGLANRDYALALPDGSIRAIIALALIVLFAVLAVYLYVGSADQTAKADLAKQLVTTLSTLIVALASFYFGSSTTASAHAKALNRDPRTPDKATAVDAPVQSTSEGTPEGTPEDTTE